MEKRGTQNSNGMGSMPSSTKNVGSSKQQAAKEMEQLTELLQD
jgi:hypothetical protein